MDTSITVYLDNPKIGGQCYNTLRPLLKVHVRDNYYRGSSLGGLCCNKSRSIPRGLSQWDKHSIFLVFSVKTNFALIWVNNYCRLQCSRIDICPSCFVYDLSNTIFCPIGSVLTKHPFVSQIWTHNSKRLVYTA